MTESRTHNIQRIGVGWIANDVLNDAPSPPAGGIEMKKKASRINPRLRLIRAAMVIKENGSYAELMEALNPQLRPKPARPAGGK